MGSSSSKTVFKSIQLFKDFSPPDERLSRIGKFLYTPNEVEIKSKAQWDRSWKKYRSIKKIVEGFKENKHNKGFPQSYRWEVWKTLVSLKISQLEYESIPRKSESSYDINKDIQRTFPEHPYFDTSRFGLIGQNALRRVLEKFAYKWPNIGYCQGMNFVVAFLLIVSGGKEVEVYFFLEKIKEKLQLETLFQEDMVGLKDHLWVFDKLFEENLDKLYWHFRDQDVSEDMWVLKWFLTIFTRNFTEDVAVFIWDLIVLEGFQAVYKVALAVLKINEEKLFKMNTYQVVEFFSSKFLTCSPQNLLKKAVKVKLTPEKKVNIREYKSLPCPSTITEQEEKDLKLEVSSPKITLQMIVEEPPELIKSQRGYHSAGNWQIINPFLVVDSVLSENAEDSFNAEDVLNNLVTETDWEVIYKL